MAPKLNQPEARHSALTRRSPSRRRDPKSISKTQAMIALYRQGLTYQQVGDHFGVIKQTVAARLKKAGEPRRTTRYRKIDRQRLEILYALERRPLKEIAHRLKTGVEVIKRAIKHHHLVLRPPLPCTNGPIDGQLKKLAVGKIVRLKTAARNPLERFETVGRKLGMTFRASPVEAGKNGVFDLERIA